jgi:hypothetical protein
MPNLKAIKNMAISSNEVKMLRKNRLDKVKIGATRARNMNGAPYFNNFFHIVYDGVTDILENIKNMLIRNVRPSTIVLPNNKPIIPQLKKMINIEDAINIPTNWKTEKTI